MTDVCDIEGMFRIIESIPSKNAEPIKMWLAKKQKPKGLKENKKVAKLGGEVAKNTRKDIEEKLRETVVSKQNYLDYQYIEENKQLESSKQ